MYLFGDFTVSEAARSPHYLVVGHPIGHSLSPMMHNFALTHHEIDAIYHAVDLEFNEIDKFISWINRETFLGANITIPYKQEMIRVVDHISESVREIGALNTISKRKSKIIGHNTDVSGFTEPLKTYADRLEGERAVIFGTGGAARSVVFGLKQLDLEEIVLVTRNPANLTDNDPLFDDCIRCSYQNWQAYGDDALLFVNATPLGMKPDTESSPVRKSETYLLTSKICYDLVYNPIETRFLKDAKAAGAETLDGLKMFIHQGNEAFKIWTGKTFPINKIYKELKTVLER